jgi:uncharacterized protein YecE (DUF72 family)
VNPPHAGRAAARAHNGAVPRPVRPPPTAEPDLFGPPDSGGTALAALAGQSVAGRAPGGSGLPAVSAVSAVQPAVPDAALAATAAALARRFGNRLHLGTSSWYFPGWAGLVWDRPYPLPQIRRAGLAAYAAHPLLRTVSLDRAFYRPLSAESYAGLAAQVPADFRFVVKAPALVSDALLREAGSGAPAAANPLFLDPARALADAVLPAAAGLGDRLGVLVFQLSPLPVRWLADPAALLARLDALWAVVLPALPAGALAALELRDAALLTPGLAAALKAHGVRYCLGGHARLPTLADQLPLLRATWPGDLVCRWNLQRGQRYAQARDAWAPFDRLQQPDLPARQALARAVVGTLGRGHRAFVTVNNKAEGSAPLSVLALAEQILALADGAGV